MDLTAKEVRICLKYGTPDENGFVNCVKCPLLMRGTVIMCKANCTEEEWIAYQNEKKMLQENENNSQKPVDKGKTK